MANDLSSLLQPGCQSAISSAARHLTQETMDTLLGLELARFSKGGTGKTLLTLACYADGMRVVFNALLADGEISREEVDQAESFLAIVAAYFAKVRPEYSQFAMLTRADIGPFLEQYQSDSGPFGFKDASTKWSGVNACQRIADQCGDSTALDTLRVTLVNAAETLLSADGMDDREEQFLEELRRELGAESGDSADEVVTKNSAEGPMMDDAKILTLEIAEQYLADQNSLDLYKFTAIEDAAAESLSNYSGDSLDLRDLTSLSDAAAESLSQHTGHLSFSGLTSVSDAAVESLSKCTGSLDLSGLTRLSDAATESLSKCTACLDLNGLTSLSDAAAESLSQHTGEYLGLDGLTSLSDAAAESLSQVAHHLDLEGLTSLSDAAAESLSQVASYLDLKGLTSLSDAAAESLSRFSGYWLDLSGLMSVSDAAVESLSKCTGFLDLSGLSTLSDEAARWLACVEDEADLDVGSWPDSAHDAYWFLRLFRYYPDGNELASLCALTRPQAQFLAKQSWFLDLSGISAISDEIAEALSNHTGTLCLSNLAELSVDAASSLVEHEGPLLVTLSNFESAVQQALLQHPSVVPQATGMSDDDEDTDSDDDDEWDVEDEWDDDDDDE